MDMSELGRTPMTEIPKGNCFAGLTVKPNHLESFENPRRPKPLPAGNLNCLSPLICLTITSLSPSAGPTR